MLWERIPHAAEAFRVTQHLAAPLTYVLVYGRLKHRFRAGLYEEIADGWFAEVLAFLGEELRWAQDGAGPRLREAPE